MFVLVATCGQGRDAGADEVLAFVIVARNSVAVLGLPDPDQADTWDKATYEKIKTHGDTRARAELNICKEHAESIKGMLDRMDKDVLGMSP